eukprot:XP_011421698.1 PREDICTED: uncharacterized protein LOC105324331 [Crassostrea gigas]
MSWASTAIYYDKINRGVRAKMGKRHSAPIIVDSLDFEPIATAQYADDWDGLTKTMVASARRLEVAGCEGAILCSNTMHKVYEAIADAVDIPILHIGDATADAMQAENITKAALLGTRFTMSEPFMREHLEGHGFELAIPDSERMTEINRIIYEELVMGEARTESKRTLKTILTNLGQEGNEAAVLACTELVMIVNTNGNVLPIFDTTTIHAEAAVEWILADN